jgi:hypothetical protein
LALGLLLTQSKNDFHRQETLIFQRSNIMKSSRECISLGLATALLMCVVATASGTQMQAMTGKQGSTTETTARTTASTARTKRQRMAARGPRKRYSTLTLNASAKKTKRVPRAKSLSKESY